MLTQCLLGDDDEDEVEYTEETTEYVKGTEYRKVKGTEYRNVEPAGPGHDEDETTEYVRGNQYTRKPQPAVNDANYQPPRQPGGPTYSSPSNGNYQQPGADDSEQICSKQMMSDQDSFL